MDNKFINKFLKGSAFSSVGTLFTIVFHFLSIKILAEGMPREAFGLYSIVIVVSHGFQILGGLGLNLTLVKNLSGEIEGDNKAVVTSIFLARIVQLIFIGLLVFAFGHLVLPRFFEGLDREYIIYIPLIFGLASIRDLLFHMLQGLQQFNKYAFINIFSSLVRFCAILYFYSVDRLTVQQMIWVEVIVYSVSLGILLLAAPIVSYFTTRFDIATFKKIFSFGGPLYANDMLTYIYNRISVLLIGGLLTPVSVALYEIASKIPEGMGRLFNSLIVVYFPSMSELLGKNQLDEGERFMNRGLILTSTGLAFASLVTFLFREEIVILVFAEQYLDAALALALLMVSFSLNAVARLMGYTVVAAGHSSVPVRINVISSVMNVIGCLVLIPRFGYIGAVYSLIVMTIISQTLNAYFLVRKAQLRPQMWNISKASLFMIVLLAAYVLWGNESLWVRFATILVYIAICWFIIPEVKKSMQYASKYATGLKWLPLRSS